MKKLFVIICSYFLALYVWGPYLIYQIFGVIQIYPSGITLPMSSITKTALIITIPIVLAIIVILALPIGNEKIQGKDNCPLLYYFFAVAISLIWLFSIGGYSNINSGGGTGQLLSYIVKFFDVTTLFVSIIQS